MKTHRTKTSVLTSLVTLCALITFVPAQPLDLWMKLYNGKDLSGWKGLPNYWKISSDGNILGNDSIKVNTFLMSDSLFSDFHLKVEGRFTGTTGYRNSGIMYRSQVFNFATYEATGYQYELSRNASQLGAFYHEKGTELPFTGGCTDPGGATDWKKMEIIADGPHVTHLLNGVKCFEYFTFKILDKGKIGLQMHFPGDFGIEFRNIFIQPLHDSFKIPSHNSWNANGVQMTVDAIQQGQLKNRTIKNGASNLKLSVKANGKIKYLASPRSEILFNKSVVGESNN